MEEEEGRALDPGVRDEEARKWRVLEESVPTNNMGLILSDPASALPWGLDLQQAG